jgi:hypothetical protein
MNKMIEIRKMIKSSLSSVCPNVYFQWAPDDAPYPFLVYDLPNSLDDGSLEQFVFDIDGWDIPENGDTTILENLMDSVDNSLHRKTFTVNNQLSATFYRNNRLSLKDDDKRIRRRKHTYQIRVFERS